MLKRASKTTPIRKNLAEPGFMSHKAPNAKLGRWRERALWGRTNTIGRERSYKKKGLRKSGGLS